MQNGRVHTCDGTVRTARAGSDSGAGSRGVNCRSRGDGESASGSLFDESGFPDRCQAAARSNYVECADGAADPDGGFDPACSSSHARTWANLILARTVRREGELAIRAALGAGTGAATGSTGGKPAALRQAGAALGLLSAGPLVAILARYASRFSVRALDLTVDPSMVWVGVILALLSAVLLAFVPRLPNAGAAHGYTLGSARVTGGTVHRRQQVFVDHAGRRVLRAAGGCKPCC